MQKVENGNAYVENFISHATTKYQEAQAIQVPMPTKNVLFGCGQNEHSHWTNINSGILAAQVMVGKEEGRK